MALSLKDLVGFAGKELALSREGVGGVSPEMDSALSREGFGGLCRGGIWRYRLKDLGRFARDGFALSREGFGGFARGIGAADLGFVRLLKPRTHHADR